MGTAMVFVGLFAVSAFLWHGASGSDGVSVSVMEGDSVTLNTEVKRNEQEKMNWYFNEALIAAINGDLSFICTDVQCNNGTERFRDRLEVNQAGSLTIMNTTNTDSGVYHLQINSSRFRSFGLTVTGSAVQLPTPKGIDSKDSGPPSVTPGLVSTRGFRKKLYKGRRD